MSRPADRTPGLKQQPEQRQQLKLALTPAVRQSLTLLRLSGEELARYLADQAAANPALDLRAASAHGRRRPPGGATVSSGLKLEAQAPAATLEQALLEQLRLTEVPPAALRAARYLAGCLDASGYLTQPLPAVAAALRLPEAVAAAGLQALQALEPAGIGARSLQECLLLQLDRLSAPPALPAPHGTAEAVRGGLELIAKRDYNGLARLLRTDSSQAEAIVRFIRTQLNPRPGLALQPEDGEAPYVEPDAEIRLSGARIEVALNDRHLPQLVLNAAFDIGRGRTAEPADEDFAAYAAERSRSARALLHGLEQRHATLLKVVAAVAEAQLDFLQRGPGALKPLQLQELADRLGLHVSTVSRAIRHKHVMTPLGLLPLKQFLSGALPASRLVEDGPPVSARQAMERIRHWIGAENPKKPHSDRELAERLAAEGIILSRRTVAKYREALRLLASPLRKDRT